MNLLIKKTVFMFLFGVFFLSYFFTLIFHFNIIISPILALFCGLLIRLIFREKYLPIFTALFPIASGFASFENHGMPLNYLLLPLLLLVGIYIGEFILDRKKALSLLDNINAVYFVFLLILLISFIFLILRWSNLTVDLSAFFKNTQVSPQNRLSFAIFFPLLYINLFFISYIFRLYILKEGNRIKLFLYFLFGFSVTAFFSFLQKFAGIKTFLGHNVANGLATDASAFGFLSSIAFLLAFFLIYKYEYTKIGAIYMLISFFSILFSQTRIGFIAIVFILLFVFFKLKLKKKFLLILIVLILFVNIIYYINGSNLKYKFTLINEIEGTFWDSLKYIMIGPTQKNIKNIASGRDLLWGYSFNVIKKYPFTGVGTGNFVFYVNYDNFPERSFHHLPANQYLFFSSSIGLIGLLIFFMFLYSIFLNYRGVELYIVICILIIMFFGDFFWFPECFLGFWLIASIGHEDKVKLSSLKKYMFYILIIIFFLLNLNSFNDLHPKTWAKETNTRYDYGFWYAEKNTDGKTYRWTKTKSGVYIYLKDGISQNFKILCGAPLGHLPDKKQVVKIYWRGKLYDEVVFVKNREFVFQIRDDKFSDGFLEFRIDPIFNLKKMNLSPETRNLGVQVFEGK